MNEYTNEWMQMENGVKLEKDFVTKPPHTI